MRALATAAMLLLACGPSPRPGHAKATPRVALPPALALVSGTAPLVFIIHDPAAADAGLGWSQVTAALGAPFLSPAALADSGIATDRPIVVALDDAEHGVWTVTAELRDRTRAIAWVLARARATGVPLAESSVASARVFLPAKRGDLAVVARGRQLVLVLTPGPQSVRDLSAVRVAGIDRADSLAADPQVAATLDALPHPGDVSIYVDVDRLARQLLAPGDRELTVIHTLDDLQRRLARAQASGADTAALRQQVALLTQISARARASRELVARLVAPLGTLAIGLDTAPDRLRGELATAPAPGSLPDRLLPGAPTAAPITRARPGAFLALDLRADPAAVATVVNALLAARGTSLAELAEAGDADRLALDLRGALTGNLTGDVGLALGPGAPPAVLAAARLRNPVRGRDLVDRVATAPLLRGRVSRPAPGRATIDLPGQGTLAVAQAGPLLALTSDPSALDAITAAPAPRRGPAAVVSARGTLLPLLLAPDAPPPTKLLMLSDGSPAPVSSELAAARDAVNQARARLTEVQAEAAKRRLAYLTRMGEHAGDASLSFARRGALVEASGAWRPPGGSLRAAIATLAGDLAQLAADARDQARREGALRQSIDALQRRAGDIRQRDVEAWKHTRGAGVGEGAQP